MSKSLFGQILKTTISLFKYNPILTVHANHHIKIIFLYKKID